MRPNAIFPSFPTVIASLKSLINHQMHCSDMSAHQWELIILAQPSQSHSTTWTSSKNIWFPMLHHSSAGTQLWQQSLSLILSVIDLTSGSYRMDGSWTTCQPRVSSLIFWRGIMYALPVYRRAFLWLQGEDNSLIEWRNLDPAMTEYWYKARSPIDELSRDPLCLDYRHWKSTDKEVLWL